MSTHQKRIQKPVKHLRWNLNCQDSTLNPKLNKNYVNENVYITNALKKVLTSLQRSLLHQKLEQNVVMLKRMFIITRSPVKFCFNPF